MIADSGAELWYALVEMAGLESETSYDRDICDQVGRALGLGWGRDLGEEIERAGSDTTAVLIAVLGALQPWAEMMRDLLELMEGCGANRTRTQLRANVDVDRASRELELDLSNFAEAIEEYEEVAAASGVAWPVDALMALSSLLPGTDAADRQLLRDEVRRWLAAYEPDEPQHPVPDLPWPEPLPGPPPPCGDPELDRALAVAWSAWEAVVRMAAAGSSTRLDLYEKGEELRRDEGDLQREGTPTLGWIAALDHDRFAAHVVAGLDEVARRAREGDTLTWGFPGHEHSPQDLIDLVGRLPAGTGGASLMKRLRHLLALPVWKHRYDIYSNWVFTVIVAALRDVTEVKVEHDEGLIDFGFAAARMATADEHDLAVYCELRSPLVGESKKREYGVQPDYSILIGDSEDPRATSVVEVECKQYKSAGRENFAAALQDYARSRPRASVVLVNYGPVSVRVRSGILEDVDSAERDRCRVIGAMRPASSGAADDSARTEFAAAVREGVGIEPAALDLPIDTPMRIDLYWSGRPPEVDLDLHLEFGNRSGSGLEHVSYAQAKAGEPVHASLVEDVRQGPGPESLWVERWLGGTYRVWVHRYDKGDLGECEPRVTLSSGALQPSFVCPDGAGPWWCVLEVDGGTGRVSPVNRRDLVPSWL